MTARIGMVEDHPAVVDGMAAMLRSTNDLRVVIAAANAAALVRESDHLDLVLLDLMLPDSSSPSENVNALAPLGAPVVAFTSGEQPQLVREAARAGVAAMIRKTEARDAVIDALRRVLKGEPVASPDWASALINDHAFVDAMLSIRETEVLARYAAGETAESVAAMLYISRETVLDHLRRIRSKYAKVGRAAPTKVDLFRRAVEDQIVYPQP